ncbi:MAG: hypothetical protein AAFV72_03780 [Cyanobacteria bacterium J06635_1]
MATLLKGLIVIPLSDQIWQIPSTKMRSQVAIAAFTANLSSDVSVVQISVVQIPYLT